MSCHHAARAPRSTRDSLLWSIITPWVCGCAFVRVRGWGEVQQRTSHARVACNAVIRMLFYSLVPVRHSAEDKFIQVLNHLRVGPHRHTQATRQAGKHIGTGRQRATQKPTISEEAKGVKVITRKDQTSCSS